MMFVFSFVPLMLVQVGLLNVGGYYDSLLTLFDNMHAQGFLKSNARTLVVSAPTPAELLDKLEVSVDQDLDLTPIQMHIVATYRCCAINLYESFRGGNFVFL
jgi:predicted Rossmann-fold nucleotide-binding protein